MFDFNSINNWRKYFGLYPISIKPSVPNTYALLSGGLGDFCVDLRKDGDCRTYNSYAWSSNTKNYVAVRNDKIELYNWLKSTPEIIPLDYVSQNITKFYQYLNRSSYTTDNDVVPFVVNLFRKMRNITHEGQSPIEALNLLYILLLSLKEDINHIDFNSWGIQSAILPSQFDFFIDELHNGIGETKPDIEIILRHCSGPIFQEAHRIVDTFFLDRNLFGDISSKLITSQSEYSSTFYTPQYVARTIVEQCLKYKSLDNENITIFDPACGSGEFLVEILKQLQELNYTGSILVRGWDNSECGVNTTRFLLTFAKKEFWNERLNIDLKLVRDSIEEPWTNDVDILLMNPPFKSWELLSKNEREIISASFPYPTSKLNQSIAFFYKAINALSSNGVLGCVMPSSFFTSDSYSQIRKDLEEALDTLLVGKLGNYVFTNAITDVSIYIGAKKETSPSTILVWCSNEKGIAQKALCSLRKMQEKRLVEYSEDNFSIYSSLDYPDERGSWKVISKRDYIFKQHLETLLQNGQLIRLQSVFTVKQGVRTGDNSIFIISISEYDKLPDTEKRLYRPSIDNEAIDNGVIKIKNYIWYPYTKDGIIIASQEQLMEEAPFTYHRLHTHKDKLKNRASLLNKEIWWALSRHRKWLLNDEIRIVSTEFGSPKSFAIDLSGHCVIERGHAWIPKKDFSKRSYYFYLAFFSSTIFGKILSIYSKQLGGGYWYDLSAKYSNHIPIPNVNQENLINSDAYQQLSMLGESIVTEGTFYIQSRIDELVRKILFLE